MSLVTGKKLRQKKWTELPLPNWVVDRVHYMAQKQKQIWMPGGTPIVATSRNRENIPSVEGDGNDDDSAEDKTKEFEEEMLPSNAEDEVVELVETQDALGLNEDTEPVNDDLGITENTESSANIIQGEAEEANFDDTNLPLGQ